MTTNQPPRKRNLLSVLEDVEAGELTPEQAEAEIQSQKEDES